MILKVKQWESKYIREFDVVKNGAIPEGVLFSKLAAMYYDFSCTNNIEPFTITYGKGKGYCINANSHIGVIVYEDIVLYITSMIPELTLGKILYLKSQADEVLNASTTRKVLTQQLNDEESISAVDYFVVSLLDSIEEIYSNGLIEQLTTVSIEQNNFVGRLDIGKQVRLHPAYDKFCVEKTVPSKDILINQILKAALQKAKELTSLEWIIPLLENATKYFETVTNLSEFTPEEFPSVTDYTGIRRNDYERGLQFSKYILFGYDPIEGESAAYFPEFMLDMNEVFEFYVTSGLRRIFKTGFEQKKRLTLGLGPTDIPIDRKFIELDGFYKNGDKSIVLDTKNKYKSVLDKASPDFIASNPDIFQLYYYASRVNSTNIILVYPSSKKRTTPIAHCDISFPGNKTVQLYCWALQITGTPRENKNALIALAEFMDEQCKKKH